MAEIEKVIEELNKSIERCEYMKADYSQFADEVEDSVKEAIQTIRELQGKSEEVCEWKYEQVIEYASSECGGFDTHRIYFNTFKYCPYCGKKIKVVWYDKRRTDFCI